MFSGRCFIAAMLVAVFFSGSAQAKPNLSDWSSVQGLKLGSKLLVSTKKGDRLEGELKHVDADSLLLLVRVSRSARQAIELRRDDVSEVRKPTSRVLTTALGLGIGLGVGIGIGAIYDSQHTGTDDPGLGKLFYGAPWAPGRGWQSAGFCGSRARRFMWRRKEDDQGEPGARTSCPPSSPTLIPASCPPSSLTLMPASRAFVSNKGRQDARAPRVRR